MLRITELSQTAEETVLQVEGWIAAAGVTVLDEEGAHALGQSRLLVLDLDGVRGISPAGLALLQRWSREKRLQLRGGSSYVRQLVAPHLA